MNHDLAAQNAAEAALAELYEQVDEGDCGCDTCTVRTILEAAWPHLRLAALEEG